MPASRPPSLYLVRDTHEDLWGQEHFVDHIGHTIFLAINDGRLQPGAKLIEQDLIRYFKAPKILVTQAVLHLRDEGLVTLRSPTVAIVCNKEEDEIHEALKVRKLIECEILRQLSSQITASQIFALRKHVCIERAETMATAEKQQQSDQFHIDLAKLLNNDVLVAVLTDLLNRSRKKEPNGQYPNHCLCSASDHMQIVEALEIGNAKTTVKMMYRHLTNIDRSVQGPTHKVDLSSALGIMSE